ncbi:bifunctional DNA primase/polymerase [Streptomyces sp. SAJ15]|uniref:bifunctional DNA primase/polymerase n=1 Tax=Streptomyces sp. SAJ15 TaxID=2011095 RepID=UPI001185DE1E|nr:bifunctional DNA primase/polymerase [Streptomyces sp. SAJ15]TVL87804.1 DNA primase [Streptomyces sp. SAJ15]
MPAELRFPASDSAQRPMQSSVAGAQSLTTALWCASRGWPVHPLAPGRKTPAANCDTCRQPGHTAAGCSCLPAGRWCHGFHAATLDTARINAWWGTHPALGVGVACGPAELIVIDIDAHRAALPGRDRILPGIPIGDHINLTGLSTGFHTLAVLAALRQQPSPAEDTSTLRVRTPSGGLHIWYRTDQPRRWLCSAGSSAGRALAWQVDVRAHGGYIIAPGTITRAGTYTALPGATEPALLPGWLAHDLQRTGHLQAPAVPTPRPVPPRAAQAVIAAGGDNTHVRRTINSVLEGVTDCGRISEGAGFSSTLNRAAYTLGGLVAASLLPRSEAESLLRAAAAAARPGQERRAEQIIRSGLAAGTQRPLHPGSRT